VYSDVFDIESCTLFLQNICGYIAGFVAKKLIEKYNCIECTNICTSSSDKNMFLKLTSLKNRGPLINPSDFIIKTCWLIELKLRSLENELYKSDNLRDIVKKSVLSSIDIGSHNFNHDHCHINSLLEDCIGFYIKIKQKSIAKKLSNKKTFFTRQKFTRLMNFWHI
jgi:hypothetical protein